MNYKTVNLWEIKCKYKVFQSKVHSSMVILKVNVVISNVFQSKLTLFVL